MRWPKNLYISLILLFFYIPIIVLIVFSFNDSKYAMTWHGFTWHWYQVLFADKDLLRTAWHSILLAGCASSLSVILGTIIATALFRYRFKSRLWLHNLILILIITPDLVVGIVLLILFTTTNLSLGFWSLLLAHTTLCLPFVILTVYSRARDLDPAICESAQDLGASDSMIFFKIIIPLLRPAIIAGWLLSFSLSLDDVIVSFFVSGPEFAILPLRIYSMTRVGVTPEINALSGILLILTFTLVFTAQFVQGKDS